MHYQRLGEPVNETELDCSLERIQKRSVPTHPLYVLLAALTER